MKAADRSFSQLALFYSHHRFSLFVAMRTRDLNNINERVSRYQNALLGC